MLTHAQLWTALDRLAALARLSPSGLAKAAGLDPTTFNKSKRVTAAGRERWPSTESVAKALAATDTDMDTFVRLIAGNGRPVTRALPLIGYAQAANDERFDDAGVPVGKLWGEMAFPAIDDENAYAIKISGNALEPAYRDGTVLVVSPSALIQRGDRVTIKTRDGAMMVRELKRRTSRIIELRSVDRAQAEHTLPLRDVLWLQRIIWASQ